MQQVSSGQLVDIPVGDQVPVIVWKPEEIPHPHGHGRRWLIDCPAAFSQAVDRAIEFLFEDGFKRNQELEADRTATELLALTGYDPLRSPGDR